MDKISQDAKAAAEMGISYGQYIALTYDPDAPWSPPSSSNEKKTKRRYTDELLFRLWQEGKTDPEIGAVVGVSRQLIQRWRDQMELPSTAKNAVDTKKYRLTTLRDGTCVAIHTDEL